MTEKDCDKSHTLKRGFFATSENFFSYFFGITKTPLRIKKNYPGFLQRFSQHIMAPYLAFIKEPLSRIHKLQLQSSFSTAQIFFPAFVL